MVEAEYRCPRCGFKGVIRVDEDKENPEDKRPRCEDCSELMEFVDSWDA